MATLAEQSLTVLKGVGKQMAARFSRIGIESVENLLFHLPTRYQDRTRITPIAHLALGSEAVVEGKVLSTNVVGRNNILVCQIQDDTGILDLVFFHYSQSQIKSLVAGAMLSCFGEIRQGFKGLQIAHPEYHRIGEAQFLTEEACLTPIYPITEGISQTRIRQLIQQALKLLKTRNPLLELLPDSLSSRFVKFALNEAIAYVHNPPPTANIHALEQGRHPAQQRLVFEELLAHHLSLQALRRKLQSLSSPCLTAGRLLGEFTSSLPFQLTQAQQRVFGEIKQDLAQNSPMLRLVQGDVGSGKTVVAAMAALIAIESNCQVAIMAPTELLAVQHFATFSQWLEPLNKKCLLLSSQLKAKEKKQILASIAQGEAQLIIGTHAIFQKQVEFANLALVVIDEQHRFGVHQRRALLEKGSNQKNVPHQLIMTATPIPRTLSMTVYADLDCSVIDELPPGRASVVTAVIADRRRDEVIEHVRQACNKGRQAYWVCTLIDESEVLQCQAAEKTAEDLNKLLGPLKVGLVHGRMKPSLRAEVMDDFKQNKIDLLVATTVIEVGVDVVNASLMIIENPERLGLAQLHQLRGRVGRGSTQSHCILMYHAPLSKASRARLKVMKEAKDGFEIAQKDLELRGPGELLGVRQTGELRFRVAEIIRDSYMLDEVKRIAVSMVEQAPEQAQALTQRWLVHGTDCATV